MRENCVCGIKEERNQIQWRTYKEKIVKSAENFKYLRKHCRVEWEYRKISHKDESENLDISYKKRNYKCRNIKKLVIL